jgi:hypothetical protein
MPTLLEDLAREMSASYRRVADRLDAEGREMDDRQEALEAAQEGTDYVLSQLPLGKGYWQWALTKIRKNPPAEQAMHILRAYLGLCESVLIAVEAVRNLWITAERLGAAPERFAELAEVDTWFKDRIADVRQGIESRLHPWHPSDPERFALGLKLAREGKTIPADELIARFRRTGS